MMTLVGTLKDGYVRKVPLPRAPRIQHSNSATVVGHSAGDLKLPTIWGPAVTGSYWQLPAVTGSYRQLPAVTVTGSYRQLPAVTGSYRQLPAVTPIGHDTCYLAQVPRIPRWSDLTRSLVGLGRRTLLPFSPLLV